MSEIVWEFEGTTAWQHALIGKDGDDFVFGVIHPGFNTNHGWEVVISESADKPEGWMVACGDTDDLEQAKRDCDYYGKEWIKGDSPIWAEK